MPSPEILEQEKQRIWESAPCVTTLMIAPPSFC
jgi:hypothetical protein